MDSSITRSAVVTGVSSGIGEAIAETLINDGYHVFGSVRKQTDADRLSASLGEQFTPMLFDVCDSDAIKNGALMVSEALGGRRLDTLVNNAGLASFGPMECLDDDAFEHIVAVNLLGVRLVTNAFLPLIRGNANSAHSESSKDLGKIINISSLSGILNTPMNGAYCVSKHALESLGDIYRRELLPEGIKVFAIRSGPIQSKIWTKNESVETNYDNPYYQQMSLKAQAIMKNAAENALPASVIADVVSDILANRKKKISYQLGRGAFVATFLSLKFPPRIADWLINKGLSRPVKSS